MTELDNLTADSEEHISIYDAPADELGIRAVHDEYDSLLGFGLTEQMAIKDLKTKLEVADEIEVNQERTSSGKIAVYKVESESFEYDYMCIDGDRPHVAFSNSLKEAQWILVEKREFTD